MPGCVADYCTNSAKKGFKMCRFPRNPERRKIWVENTGRQDWTPSNNSMLCEVHFDTEMWTESKTGNSKRMLKKNAIPTIFGELVLQNIQKGKVTNIAYAKEDIIIDASTIVQTTDNENGQSKWTDTDNTKNCIITDDANISVQTIESDTVSSEGTLSDEELSIGSGGIKTTENSDEKMQRLLRLFNKSERLRKEMKKKLQRLKRQMKRLRTVRTGGSNVDAIKPILNETQIKLLTGNIKKVQNGQLILSKRLTN